MKKLFLILFLFSLVFSTAPSFAEDEKTSFYPTDAHVGSPEHYYNDALIAESEGKTLDALLALRRALVLNPGFHVAQEHLSLLLKKMDLPPESSWQDRLAARYSPETLILTGSLVGWSGALLFVVLLFMALGASEKSFAKKRWPFVVALFFFFLGHGAAFFGTMIDPRMRAREEVMIKNKTSLSGDSSSSCGIALRSTPADTASILVQLPPGVCVKLLSQHGVWSYVKTPNGQTGWIPSSVMESVVP